MNRTRPEGKLVFLRIVSRMVLRSSGTAWVLLLLLVAAAAGGGGVLRPCKPLITEQALHADPKPKLLEGTLQTQPQATSTSTKPGRRCQPQEAALIHDPFPHLPLQTPLKFTA